MMKTPLTLSYEHAIEVMKTRAVSFYYAFSKLPRERFDGIAAIYAFCRCADDLIDTASKSNSVDTLKKLNQLEEDIRNVYRGVSPLSDFIWWLALEDTIRQFRIPIEGFLMQIEGQRRDAFFKSIKTTQELLEYCRLVAGSVGRLLAPLLSDDRVDLNDPDFVKACETLGCAMQITNILRDVGEDLRERNRVYLPEELLEKYNLSKTLLKELVETKKVEVPSNFIALWEELSDLADDLYCSFEPWLSSFHPKCRTPLATSAIIYRAISDAVRKEKHNCFHKRCYTDTFTRNKWMLRAAVNPSFPFCKKRKNNKENG